MTAAPPLDAGGDHVTSTCVLAAVPTTVVGAPETVRGETALDALEALPVPAGFVAVTVNVYGVPFANSVTVHWRGPDVHEHVRPPGSAVTV